MLPKQQKGHKARTYCHKISFLGSSATLADLEKITRHYGGPNQSRNEAVRHAIHRLAKSIVEKPGE